MSGKRTGMSVPLKVSKIIRDGRLATKFTVKRNGFGMPREVSLNRLKQGFHGVSPILGAAHAEACLVCLSHHKHTSGISLKLQGTFDDEYNLAWDDIINEQIERSWDDLTIATEWAACGIAFLLIEQLTEYTVIRQARKGNGFDYWLGIQDNETGLFQNKAYLEVSGILKADNNSSIKARLNQKLLQIHEGDDMPAYAIVVEFSQPIALIGEL